MRNQLLTSVFCALGAFAVSAQTSWDKEPAFTTYTDANNPVKPGGNNLLQGARFTSWVCNNNWSELPGGPFATYTGNNFTTGNITYTAPKGRGTSQWMAQLSLITNYKIEKDKKYDLSFHVKSTAANKFTVKVEDIDSPDSRNMAYTYVTLPADKELLFVLHDISPSTNIPHAKLIFDAGGAEIGSTIVISDIILQSADDLSDTTPALPELSGPPEGYELVWSDEFDRVSSLTSKWDPMDWAAGNVNHELQTYKPGRQEIAAADGTSRHTAEIRDGVLSINCFKGKDGKIYSGRMDSHDATGPHSGYAAWRYGYIEARIKLPSGKGTWPAFWMMPEGVNWTDETWPTCGEIDIMEEVGNDPNNCVSSLHAIGHYHANNTQVSASRHIDNMEGGWITYAMLWDNNNIAMYADGKLVLSYENDHEGYINWPYDRPYYVTLNLAWGGDWGGAGGVDPSALPLTMEVDYVRVYQLPEPTLEEENIVYIHGPFNGIAKDGIVPSSTFDSWEDNHIPLRADDKVFSKTFTVGRNLHPQRVDFMFASAPKLNVQTAFTPDGDTYRVTLDENPYLKMNPDGHITLKDGATLRDGDEITVTLDCSKGNDKAVITVGHLSEIKEIAAGVAAISDNSWYDLMGRRIERPTLPGLYIHEGRKVVVKS